MSKTSNAPITSSTDETSPTTTSARNQRKNGFKRGNDNTIVGAELKAFVGETPEIDGVLTLLSERFDKGISFNRFQEKSKTYTLKNYKKGEDVALLITNLETTNFETTHRPPNLSPFEVADTTKFKMWELKLKKYMDRIENMNDNIVKLYGVVDLKANPLLSLHK